jgi:hypothetical protein
MNSREKEQLVELRTHILYIKENMGKIDQKLDKLPCDTHTKRLMTVEDSVGDIKEEKNWGAKKMIAVITAISTIIAAVISAVVAKFF